jgi:hypothetical protein
MVDLHPLKAPDSLRKEGKVRGTIPTPYTFVTR